MNHNQLLTRSLKTKPHIQITSSNKTINTHPSAPTPAPTPHVNSDTTPLLSTSIKSTSPAVVNVASTIPFSLPFYLYVFIIIGISIGVTITVLVLFTNIFSSSSSSATTTTTPIIDDPLPSIISSSSSSIRLSTILSSTSTPIPLPISSSSSSNLILIPITWTIPGGGGSLAPISVNYGDTLAFTFSTGTHNVNQIKGLSSYNTCSFVNDIVYGSTSPVYVMLTSSNGFLPNTIVYFACSLPNHCTSGLKLQVTIGNPPLSSTSTPIPTSTPAPIPTSTPLPTSTPIPTSTPPFIHFSSSSPPTSTPVFSPTSSSPLSYIIWSPSPSTRWDNFNGGFSNGACASSPTVFMAFSGVIPTSQGPSSSNGFLIYDTTISHAQPLIPTASTQSVTNYAYGGMAILANHNVMIFGGVNNAPTHSNDINWSPDGGNSYIGYTYTDYFQYQTIAPWSKRYSFGYGTVPLTNLVFLTGGACGNGCNSNDIWISSDGAVSTDPYTPPVWTLHNAAGPLPANSEGCNMILGYPPFDTTMALLFGIGGSGGLAHSNDIFISTDLGLTFNAYLQRSLPVRSYANVLIDSSNTMYTIGGETTNGLILRDAWISYNFGISWINLMVVNPTPYVVAPCMGIIGRQIYSWGGYDVYSTGMYEGVFIANITSNG